MITVCADRTKDVEIPMQGSTFTAVVKSLRERQRARAAQAFSRVGRGLLKMQPAFPAKPAEGDGEAPAPLPLTVEQQEEFLEISADLIDDLLATCAYGVSAIRGVQDESGRELQVPTDHAARIEFFESFFEFEQLLPMALAVIEINSVSPRDAGN